MNYETLKENLIWNRVSLFKNLGDYTSHIPESNLISFLSEITKLKVEIS